MLPFLLNYFIMKDIQPIKYKYAYLQLFFSDKNILST
jgi:hypothetical protein